MRARAWSAIVSRFGEPVVLEPGCEVHGRFDGVALRLRLGKPATVETTLPFERFALRITPRGGEDFDTAFAVVASPTELPRLVLDEAVRARLLAIVPRPMLYLDPPVLVLEAPTLDVASALAALEAMARLARSLCERAAMCARG